MALLGFTKLKEKLLDGSKTQTIRKLRKNPIKVGEKLYLYWKLRTKDCFWLFNRICKETFFIEIIFEEKWLDSGKPIFRIDRYKNPKDLGCMTLTDNQCEELAKKDGFESALAMLRALKKMHKSLDDKTFQVIRW